MAVTYYQQPTANSIQASDTPITFVFGGSNYLQPNFCYIVQVYLNNVIVSTDMVFAERGSGRAHFDVSQIMTSLITASPRSANFYNAVTLSQVKIDVAERYGTTPVTYTPASSNSFKVMKARCPDDQYYPGWLTGEYTPSADWLTDVPQLRYQVSRTNSAYASILNTDFTVLIGVTLYDLVGDPAYIHNEYAPTPFDRLNFCISATSLAPILAAAGMTIAQVGGVEIQMNLASSIYFQFVDSDCEMRQQVSWLNNLGSYDQMIFSHNREVSRSISALTYKKQFGAWSGNSFVYDALSTGDTVYVKEITPTGTVHTGWISEEYRNWLIGVTESPDVQLHLDGVTEKVVVTNTQVAELKHEHEEVMNLSLTYTKSSYKSVTL